MASRKIEDIHEKSLKKLLSDSGLVCIRPPPRSNESSTVSGESEGRDLLVGEEQLSEEDAPEEEVKQEPKVEEEEKVPEIFPTPSLRLILPDKVRKLEKYNRVHVLPEEFIKEIDPEMIPRIATTAQQKYIDQIASLVGCTKYKSSLAEFWFLDNMANLLRRAQDDELDRPTQAVLMLWFCEWMKEMQHFDAASRERMLRRFKDNMLSAARYIGTEAVIPTPQDIGVYYKAQDQNYEAISDTKHKTLSDKHLVTFEGCTYECALRDLMQIIHYIYDLTDYQYELVRLVFTFSPEYSLIDGPYQINTPKRMYTPLKPKAKKEAKEKSPKKSESNQAKGKTKVKKMDVETDEYIALMALKAKDDREREEEEEKDREEWNKRCHILPLGLTAGEDIINKYWPPPPPPPEPVVDTTAIEAKAKSGKGKKK